MQDTRCHRENPSATTNKREKTARGAKNNVGREPKLKEKKQKINRNCRHIGIGHLSFVPPSPCPPRTGVLTDLSACASLISSGVVFVFVSVCPRNSGRFVSWLAVSVKWPRVRCSSGGVLGRIQGRIPRIRQCFVESSFLCVRLCGNCVSFIFVAFRVADAATLGLWCGYEGCPRGKCLAPAALPSCYCLRDVTVGSGVLTVRSVFAVSVCGVPTIADIGETTVMFAREFSRFHRACFIVRLGY